MPSDWIAIALNDLTWIFMAFAFGLLSRLVGLPPLVGFLAAGFALNSMGIASGETLEKFSDLGITLLLFSVGLKLNLNTLVKPQVWAVTGLHMSIITLTAAGLIFLLALAGISVFAGMELGAAVILGFALSFSSTVFVVKILEDRAQTSSLNGRTAIGVLIMQDLAAVLFLAFSLGKAPTAWAFLVIAALVPLRRLLFFLVNRVGHGELQVLLGLLIALGGAQLFESVNLKGDVGALAMGVMLAGHPKADELNKTLMGFKDLFLLGFFLSIGLGGVPSSAEFIVALMLIPFIYVKGGLFFLLFTRFRLRARTSLQASLNLSNYSEFGLIVTAMAVESGWLGDSWLTVLALALALSFMVAAVSTRLVEPIYARFAGILQRFQSDTRLADDQPITTSHASWAVVGMGGVGSGAYEHLSSHYPGQVVGVDNDPLTVRRHNEAGRTVIWGDPADADFWDRVESTHSIKTILLTLPRPSLSLAVVSMLRQWNFRGNIAAVARYPDEVEKLREVGADLVLNIYTEAGTGFAEHVMEHNQPSEDL